MSEMPLRAKYAQRKPVRSERPYALRQLNREMNQVEQALVSARAEIEMALRRFAARVQEQESA